MPKEFEAKVQIEGLSDLLDSLHELPSATGKNVLRRIARKRLQPVADTASALAPKLSGRLSRHISVSPKLSKTQAGQFVKEGDFDIVMHAGVESGPQSHYAHIDEFGDSRQAAQPYMRPAWDGAKLGLTKDLAADLWAEIKKSADRLARKAAKASKV
jgi:HK97 gp10 family phage protein